MSEVVIVAIISLLGTLFGTFAGILTSSKLSNYRIEQLEKKVDLHNNAVERLFIAEGAITELQHDMKDLKKKIG